MKQLTLSERETGSLKMALDLIVRLGLGQVVAVDCVLQQLHGAEVTERLLENADPTTLTCFGLIAKLDDNHSAWQWSCQQLHKEQNE